MTNSEGESSSAAPAADSRWRNFWTLGLVQISIRTGWIFKTESIIMPAVLDTMAGAAWLRGFLPMFSRASYSLSPWLLSHRFNQLRRKKCGIVASLVGMSLCFAGLSIFWICFGGTAASWLPAAFLAIYAAFFVCAGLTQLAFGTLQGKLVRATRRGRLMLLGNAGGAGVAIVAASLLLPLWLGSGDGEFHLIFAVSSVCFLVSAAIAWQLAEPQDDPEKIPAEKGYHVAESWRIITGDLAFRRVAWVAFLFGTSFVLFPHYQALARMRLDIKFSELIFWVIIQNAGTAVFSLLAGLIADWRGNRLVLRLLLFGLFLLPLTAILLAHYEHIGRPTFWVVFVLIGLIPVTMRTLQNYTLELAPSDNYPRYLSTLGLCVAAPMMASPLVGLAIDNWGFEEVFFAISGFLLIGWLQTLLLAEPRRRARAADLTGRLNVES